MGKKTIAMLEEELRLEKEKNVELESKANEPTELIALSDENELLKNEIIANKSHTEKSEARLMAMIGSMEDSGDTGACLTMTPDEYKAYSAAQGRIMGRLPNQKTKCSIEELRAAINSNKTPSWLMEKHGMNENDLQQLIWRLSSQELRDKPIKLNFKRDFFGKES